MKQQVHLGENSYPIYLENHLLHHVVDYLPTVFTGKRIMIISDDHVYPLYGEALTQNLSTRYTCSHLVLPSGEPTKSFETLPEIYRALLEANLSRSDLILALGGGVIGDLAGFAAASYLRGLPFVQVPTSLLAQVDSSVGGKVGVDLPEGKNLVGAFLQPRMVFIDPELLQTLPQRYITDGMGEVIKYGCFADADLFSLLAAKGSFAALQDVLLSVINRCVEIKREIVEKDQFDTGERMLLNFGHTLAHPIEQHFHYQQVSHGEAVSIGMYQITKMAETKGLTAPGTAVQIKEVLTSYGLPVSCGVPLSELLETISLDKKNLHGNLNLVLLNTIGDGYIYPTSLDFFQSFSGTI